MVFTEIRQKLINHFTVEEAVMILSVLKSSDNTRAYEKSKKDF